MKKAKIEGIEYSVTEDEYTAPKTLEITFFMIEAMGQAGAIQVAEDLIRDVMKQEYLEGKYEFNDIQKTEIVSKANGWHCYNVTFREVEA
jgi:hypothetical protein